MRIRKIVEVEHLLIKQLSGDLANAHVIGRSNTNKKILTMIHFSSLKKLVYTTICKCFFIVTIFFSTSCHSKKSFSLTASLSTEEKLDLEYFLRSLLFENFGAFVLFGHKPLCEMELHDTEAKIDEVAFQKWFDSLSDGERAKVEAVLSKAEPAPKLKRNPYRGWLALQKAKSHFKMKNYLFRIVPNRGRGYELTLINIKQTALVLAEHYEIFKQAAGGMDFHPLQAVFELQDPNSMFWRNVFSLQNHLAKGLLFGFGLKNSLFGNWRFSSLNGKLLPSENYKEEIEDYLKSALSLTSSKQLSTFENGSAINMAIPIFGMLPEDETAQEYAKEKVAIEKIYRGQDIVEVTLQRLAGP